MTRHRFIRYKRNYDYFSVYVFFDNLEPSPLILTAP